MAKLISVSIDVSKIDKSKLIQGKKGVYLNLTISVNDEKNQYDNDVSVWQSQEKDEREKKENKNYLGSGRVIWSGENAQTNEQKQETKQETNQPLLDDLPF